MDFATKDIYVEKGKQPLILRRALKPIIIILWEESKELIVLMAIISLTMVSASYVRLENSALEIISNNAPKDDIVIILIQDHTVCYVLMALFQIK